MQHVKIPVIPVDDKKDQAIEDYFSTKKARVRAAQKIVDGWKGGSSETEMLKEILERVAKIHPPKFHHYCPEWDMLEIDEYDPEFSACTCFK